MKLTSKSDFKALTTEKKGFDLFIDHLISDTYDKDKRVFMKLTNSQKQIILNAHDSELENLIYSYFSLRFGKKFDDRFKGWKNEFFKELTEWLQEEIK